MQAIVKLYSYYVTNTSTKLSYVHIDLTDFKFYKVISESFNEFTDFSDDKINEQEDELNTLEYENDNNNLFENNKEVSSMVTK